MIVVAHEGLNSPNHRALGITEGIGNEPLGFEGELIAGVFLLEVKFVTNPEKKIVSLFEMFALGGTHEAFVLESEGGAQVAFDQAHPEEVMVIAQASTSAFDVRFLNKNGAFEFGMARGLVLHPPFEVGGFLALNTHAAEAALKLLEKRFRAGDKACFQKGGAGLEILAPGLNRVLDAAGGVAHFEPNVPEHVKNLFDNVFHEPSAVPISPPFFVKEVDVDIALRTKLVPSESAHRNERDFIRPCVATVAFLRVFQAVLKHAPEDHGHQFGPFADKIPSSLTSPVGQAKPVLLEFEKLAVDVEGVGRASVGRFQQAAFGVAKNFF